MTALEERFVPIRGQVVRALTGGMGPSSVLLIASPVVSADLYRRTARCLCTGARVAVVDLPGSGRASRVRRPLGMEALAEFVPELLDALGELPRPVIGHSNSGPIALLAALHHRHRIVGLVLADSIGAHPSVSLWPIVAGRAIDACLEPRLTLTGWPALANNLMRHTRHFLSQIPRAAGDARLAPAAGVQVPTLLA
ncbi:MAG TPA: alpha/beta fold hydrolase [Pseudoxanthomonas sp.]|nr:alpha/beta fold hydrolase [Pseudoxanthomonas sp.]